MRNITWDDFSAGMAADGAIMSDRQVLYAHGFVVEDQRRLRSQPAISDRYRLGASNDVTTFRVFESHGGRFLVARRAGAANPYAWARIDSGSSTIESGFAELTGVTGNITGIGRWKVGGEIKPALLFSNIGEGGSTTAVYENSPLGQTGNLVSASFSGSNVIPSLTGDPAQGQTGKLPSHRVATMWKDFMCLGGIYWRAADPTNMVYGNMQRYGNMMWVSDAIDPSRYDPRYPVRAAGEGELINYLMPVEEGLLVFTNKSINLLHGEPAEFFGSTPSGALEMITTDLRVQAEPTFWDAQQSVLFVAEGRLFQYRQGRVWDISPYKGRVDNIGTYPSGRRAFPAVAAGGQNVLFANGLDGLLWCLTSIDGETGSWTTLSAPKAEDV